MNIDTSTSTFKNKDAVVVHINHLPPPPPPPPPPILARQQSDESYTPLPLSLAQPIVVVVKKKKQGQEEELPRTTTPTSISSSSLSLSSLSLKENIDKVLHILKNDDDEDDDGSNRKRKQTASPTSTMDKTIYKKRTECSFDLHPFSFTTSYDGNDDNDNTTTSRSFSSILASKRRREKHHHHVVRFNPYVQIKDTLSHQDYTTQERYNTYLQPEEFQLMKQREYLLQSKMESLVKQSYKLASYQEVFLEQERQEEDQEYDECCGEYYEYECSDEYGNSSQSSSSEYYPSSYHCIHDDQAIATAYSKISLECRSRAKQVALENRQEIETYLHDSLS